jgi:membrane-bound serine protease (ClpP class)
MATELFFILLVSGLMLIGAEIFVPGGLLGAMGAVALLGAIGAAFAAFGSTAGSYAAVGIIFLVGLVIYLWIKIFPKTRVGKRMTVSMDLGDSKATESGLSELLGKTGTASSDLRPAGFAVVDGKRVDVVSRGEMIAKGTPVTVIDVESNRVVVKKNE